MLALHVIVLRDLGLRRCAASFRSLLLEFAAAALLIAALWGGVG